MRAASLFLLLCLGACAKFPQLDDRIDAAARDAPYPTLTDISPLLVQANTVVPGNTAVAQDIAGRVSGLTARANALRGGIIEQPVLARMRRGINTSALR